VHGKLDKKAEEHGHSAAECNNFQSPVISCEPISANPSRSLVPALPTGLVKSLIGAPLGDQA
jgi:hypothetical protein